MSLQTIIQIGHKIRNELSKEESLEYHRYVKKAPAYDTKQPYSYFEVDVKDNYEIDVKSLRQVYDESIIRNRYFYLKFKTGEADSLVKYMFGDIAFPEFFRLDDPTNGAAAFRINSFLRGKEDALKIGDENLSTFRSSLEKSLNQLLQLFVDKKYCYIHFNFNGKSWYDTNLFGLVENAVVSNFIKDENGNISLTAFLTRTLAESEGRLPNFEISNTFKSKRFNSLEEVKDLLYGLDFQQKSKVNAGKDIMINVLPKGNIDAKGIIAYFDKRSNFDFKNPQSNDTDPFAEPFINPEIDGIEKYDIVFSKRSKPIGVDLLEMTDVSKNLLKRVTEKIQKAKVEIDYRYSLDYSIKSLLDEKKYNSHLLKILPLIYKDSYYNDPVLLPALIQKTEYGIRKGDKKIPFNGLKKHFYLLSKLQINDIIMEIKKSKSYQLGTTLGIMSDPFAAWRKDCPIKSFEKSYVGTLSRRISNVDDVIEFVNYLNEKLVLHPPRYNSINIKKAYLYSVELLNEFSANNTEKYNKNYCALGFFESYYTYFKSENSIEIIEEGITEN